MTSLRSLKLSSHCLLPLAVFVFFALSFILHPTSPLRTHELLDTDDYMRLNEVIHWLQSAHPFGAGWFDLSQPRLSPGDHSIIHWSRLVDLPIAFFMLPFISSYGMANAALISSFIVPPLLFALMLVLLPAMARPMLGTSRGGLACVMLLFAPALILNFMPGRVDHHAYELLIGGFGILCVQRMLLCPGGWRYAIWAALSFTSGLWISPEEFPWVIAFISALGLFASLRGGFALRNAGIFGIAFPLAIALAMPLALPSSEYTNRGLSWFSGADLMFARLSGAALVIGWALGRMTEKPWLRVWLMASLGAVAGLVFIHDVPDVLTGVYADYDKFFNETLLGNISEARPFLPSLHLNIHDPISFYYATPIFLRTVFVPLLASLVVLWNIAWRERQARLVWAIYEFFLLPALLLTLFWQVRVSWFAQLFSLVPMSWLAWSLWRCIAAKLSGRVRYWAEIAVFIAIVPLPVVLIPVMMGSAQVFPDLVLFPSARGPSICPLTHASEFLVDKYGKQPQLILSGTNEGPELLFRTPHSVLAAPYNVKGNSDAFVFFNARDDQRAHDILQKRKVDLVLVCRSIPYFYAGLGDYKARFNAPLSIDKTGHLRIASSTDHPTFIEKLVNNKQPSWLKPISIPLETNYLLFEVK